MNSKANSLAAVWDRIWFSRFDPLPASLFRSSLGLLIFIMFVANYPNWERFYGADGIISLHDAELNLRRPAEDWWSVFFWTEGEFPIRLYWWVGILAALAFTVGWQTRLATIVLFVLQTSMIHRNILIVNGDDLVFRMVLFYSCFAPLNHCFSVDSWLKQRHQAQSPEMVKTKFPSIWPIRLMQINVLAIYVFSLPYKLISDSAWLNGDMIYWVMSSNMWSRCPWPELFYQWNGLLSKISTCATVLVEAGFPILVWFPKTRLWAVAAATGLHLGIFVLIPNVEFFTLSMVCSFWVFVPAEAIRSWGARIKETIDRFRFAKQVLTAHG